MTGCEVSEVLKVENYFTARPCKRLRKIQDIIHL